MKLTRDSARGILEARRAVGLTEVCLYSAPGGQTVVARWIAHGDTGKVEYCPGVGRAAVDYSNRVWYQKKKP